MGFLGQLGQFGRFVVPFLSVATLLTMRLATGRLRFLRRCFAPALPQGSKFCHWMGSVRRIVNNS